MIRKVYEVDPMTCPKCGASMKVVAFLTEYAVVDRIIDHLKLTFTAAKSPPSQVFDQVALMAAEESGEYCRLFVLMENGSLSSFIRCGTVSCPGWIFGRGFRGY